ncbi:winged helix-turn-helix domain-containing protein [Halomarina oriensis]|uniref:HTH arsR-type domain-containing protein n=1 Tax=Halomarina oriensis TaxID=671145 RepID=A0A6B0GIV0_9EURY|nr:winged helix-turn-helix domain-containing protein [Halomarina oriensis]MWG34802.1 hypothetical protein [Halomarina oriensis]
MDGPTDDSPDVEEAAESALLTDLSDDERAQLPTPEEVEQRAQDAPSVERDPLIEALTPTSKLQILLALIRVRGEKLNPSAIADRAAVGRTSVYKHLDDLLADGLIEEAEKAGNSPMYRVDLDDDAIQHVVALRGIMAARRNDRRGDE